MNRSLCFWILLLFGLTLRLVVLNWKSPELLDDRDAYLALAQGMLTGEGFRIPGSEVPTAFRPPLYPVLLTVFYGAAGVYGIAFLQLLAGMACLWGTMQLAYDLGLRRGAWLAGFIVASDPLLLRYTAQPMTEVVSAALGIWLLWAWLHWDRHPSWKTGGMVGVLFGLSVLTRPSGLPYPVLLLLMLCWNAWLSSRAVKTTLVSSGKESLWKVGTMAVLGFCVLLPWGIRNAWQLGQFKLTTTHGGYTLLLGNNPVFYEAVVRRSWSTTWGDYPQEDPLSQPRWYEELNRHLAEQGAVTELERDRAEYQLAIQNIRSEPGTFLLSCVLREVRLWSPWPLGPEARSLPAVIIWPVALFYFAVYGLALWGITLKLRTRTERRDWLPGVAMVLLVAGVHLFFWTNARMRAPLMPILAIWAGAAIRERHPESPAVKKQK